MFPFRCHPLERSLIVHWESSVRGVGLLIEAELSSDPKDASSYRSEALFLFKQSYNHFGECLSRNPASFVALRCWGSALCKEALTLKLLRQDLSDTQKLVVEGGDKLLLAYRMAPEESENRRCLARFFFDQGGYQLAEFTKSGEKTL